MPVIVNSSFSISFTEEFSRIVKEVLSPVMGGISVYLHNRWASRVSLEVRPEVCLYTHEYLSFDENLTRNIRSVSLFGETVNVIEISPAGFEPIVGGFPVFEPQTRQVIAWVDGRRVYLLVDLLQISFFRDPGAPRILRLLFEEIAQAWTSTPQQRAAGVEVRRKNLLVKGQADFETAANYRKEKLLHSLKGKIAQGEKDVQRLQNSLRKRILEVRGQEVKLQQCREISPARTEGLKREFQKICALPHVRFARVFEDPSSRLNYLLLYTDSIRVRNPDTGFLHELGEFMIKIGMDEVSLVYRNLTRQVSGYWPNSMAPHVDDRGQPCLGNLAEMLPELVGNEEYAALSSVALQYLESVNVADAAGKHVVDWPIVEEKDGKA